MFDSAIAYVLWSPTCMSHKIESLVPCIIIVIISLKSRCTSEHSQNITTLETMTKTLTGKCQELITLLTEADSTDNPSHAKQDVFTWLR